MIQQLASLPQRTGALEPWTLTDEQVRELTGAVFAARAALEELAARLTASAEGRGLPAPGRVRLDNSVAGPDRRHLQT